MKKTGRINPITGNEILQAEEHDINWQPLEWDELPLTEQVTFLSFMKFPFLSDDNKQQVIDWYNYYRDKNIKPV